MPFKSMESAIAAMIEGKDGESQPVAVKPWLIKAEKAGLIIWQNEAWYYA